MFIHWGVYSGAEGIWKVENSCNIVIDYIKVNIMHSIYILILIISFFNILSFTGCSNSEKDHDSELKNLNIIYILANDLGYGYINCFNPEGKITVPNLDNMATNGVMFTDARTS